MNNLVNNHIYITATTFFQAAEVLWGSGRSNFAYPIIMNYAFACELTLKSMLSQTTPSKMSPDGILGLTSTTSKHGHQLDKLFNQLPSELKDKIEKNFSENCEYDLNSLLNKCSKYFESSRYVYEKKGISHNLTEMRTLTTKLINTVKKIEN
ncbi:hypothetical protein MAH4_18230 [Sessilibacter sp. MAH4]